MKLTDANNLIAKAKIEAQGMSEPFKENFAILVEWLVDKTPEAVIRCKDCRRYKCEAMRCLAFNAPMREDGFCSCGKRRTNGKTD